jgi:hypothetical protein
VATAAENRLIIQAASGLPRSRSISSQAILSTSLMKWFTAIPDACAALTTRFRKLSDMGAAQADIWYRTRRHRALLGAPGYLLHAIAIHDCMEPSILHSLIVDIFRRV